MAHIGVRISKENKEKLDEIAKKNRNHDFRNHTKLIR